ncbi:MAG: tryptophan-rich sensory protein [Ignavibacteria bacterium]|nr:tryptophan-rich sensory protein [Ignavibacteria bacterium]
MKNFFKLLLSVIICELAGIIGSIFTVSSIPTWFAGLNKPSFNPPNYLFGPVWTILYLLMGISLFLIWKKGGDNRAALILFFTQLLLNTLWSIIFFGLKMPLPAFIEVVVMWVFILLTIISFYSISKPAAYLLIPYLLWVSFASVLNFKIWMLN